MLSSWTKRYLPVPGFTFSFFASASSSTFVGTFFSAVSSISTSSFSFAALELGKPLLVLFEEKDSLDCFAGAVEPLGLPKNLLFGGILLAKIH
jgi:hypothetical protein